MVKKVFVSFFLYVWQLPQNILGFILKAILRAKKSKCALDHSSGKEIYIYRANWKQGISLGKYIILGNGRIKKETVLHEYGHQKQSMILGFLYLPLVGLPSITRNIWGRIFHKNWDHKKRANWYYSGYPERWADALGEVKRQES